LSGPVLVMIHKGSCDN